MNYPQKLISFTTENALNYGKTKILRPRFLGYLLMLSLISTAFFYVIFTRVPLELDVIRDRNLLYREAANGYVENVYTLKIINMTSDPQTYIIRVQGDYPFTYLGDTQIKVAESEVYSTIVRLELDPGVMKTPNTEVRFIVESVDDLTLKADQESRFIGPRLL